VLREKKVVSALVLASFLTILAGCSDTGTGLETATPASVYSSGVSFSQTVLPILRSAGCVSCHGDHGEYAGLNVETVPWLLQGGVHGPAIVPYNSDSSLIIQKMSPYPPFDDRMPFGGPYLSINTISVIRLWIDQGAMDN
jgi:hypothetical protein